MHEFGHIWEGHEENPIVYILEVLHATPNLKKKKKKIPQKCKKR